MNSIQPYLQLLRSNHNFRSLWLSQSIANFGDWFGMLAVYALFQQYGASEIMIGLIIVIKLTSFAVFSPFAGYLSDRFDRRTLMLICDLGRGVVVLGLLLVQTESQLWLVYPIISLQMMMAAVFEPSKSSSIPNITSREELVLANIVSTLSWSIIFTLAMAAGGFATALFGVEAVFVMNSITYLVSAWFIWRAVIPNLRTEDQLAAISTPWNGVVKGLKFLVSHTHILRPALAKAWIQTSLGALIYLLILVSDEILMMGSVGLGILYASRGLGTAVGPVLFRRYFSNEKTWIRTLGFCMVIVGVGYTLLGFAETLVVMIALVIFAHAGSSANWVASTVMIQQLTPDDYRGRVFSIEWLMLTITESVSVLIAATLLNLGLLTLRQTLFLFGCMLILAGLLWHTFITRAELRWQKMTDTSEELPHLPEIPEPVQPARFR